MMRRDVGGIVSKCGANGGHRLDGPGLLTYVDPLKKVVPDRLGGIGACECLTQPKPFHLGCIRIKAGTWATQHARIRRGLDRRLGLTSCKVWNPGAQAQKTGTAGSPDQPENTSHPAGPTTPLGYLIFTLTGFPTALAVRQS